MAKKRKRKYTNWGTLRTFDGKQYELYEITTHAKAKNLVKNLNAKGYNARAVKGRSNQDCAVYIRDYAPSSENEEYVGDLMSHYNAGRYRGAILASDLKSEYIHKDQDKKELAAIIDKLQKEKAVEKIEPKNDIEPVYKLTKKGRDIFDYDPDEFR